MVDLDGRHRQVAEMHRRAQPILRRGRGAHQRDGIGLHRLVGRGQQRGAGQRGKVRIVARIGLIEPGHERLHARRPIDLQPPRPAIQPGIHVDVAQIADIVGLVVGQEHAAQMRVFQVPQREVPAAARPRIHQVVFPAGKHRAAILRTPRIGHRRRRAAQQDLQRIVAEQPGVAGFQPLQRPPHEIAQHPVLQPRRRQHRPRAGQANRRHHSGGQQHPAPRPHRETASARVPSSKCEPCAPPVWSVHTPTGLR